MTDTPKPHLSSDEAYLTRARDLIERRDPLEEIPFHYLNDALSALGIVDNVYEGVTSIFVPEHSRLVVEKAFEVLSSNTLTAAQKEAIQKLWDYLCGGDELEKADLIFVFGGISQLAVKEAIRLKKEDYAPYILFSGKRASYMTDADTLTEAEQYRDLAIADGIRPEEILVEKQSINTVENAVNSGVLLKERQYVPKSIIAVSLPYHMKRASLTLRAGLGIDFKLIRHPGQSAKFTRDNFYTSEKGWQYIANEFIKLCMARQGGHF